MDVNTPRTLKVLFDNSIGLEQMAAFIYADFSKMFQGDPDIREFWQDLSEDEKKHAEILKDTRDSLPQDILDSKADPMMWDHLCVVKKRLMRYDKDTIRNLDDAYELAHKLESSEINALLRFLTLNYFSSPVKEAFIVSEITGHQNKLAEFSGRFGSKSWRETILSQPI